MITKFKIFENIDVPVVGDYVLIYMEPKLDLDFSTFRTQKDIKQTEDFNNNMQKEIDFINNTIGKIIKVNNINGVLVNNKKINNIIITIKYDNMPDDIEKFINKNTSKKERGGEKCIRCSMEQVIAFGKTPEETKIKSKAKKYNL